MTPWKASLVVLAGAVALAVARPARAAVTCTVNGTLTLDSQDAYYCDTSVLGSSACDDWYVVNLDSTNVKLQHMLVGVFTTGGNYLKQTTTDANGNYNVTFQLGGSQCAGQTVDMRLYFARAHEADVGLEFPRWRFWVTHLTDDAVKAPDLDLWARTENKQLTGTTSTYNKNWSRPGTFDTTRVANVYFTASETLKQVKTWSSNLDASLTFPNGPLLEPGPLFIGMESSWNVFGGWANANQYQVAIGWKAYASGGLIRHELGHVVHGHVHHLERDRSCETYNFNVVDNQHYPRGCDYGPSAIAEGIATFFGARSATGSETRSWFCSSHDNVDLGGQNWDICSEQAALPSDPDGDDDWLFEVVNRPGDFWYLGDHRVSATSDCARLVSQKGCDCPSPTFDPAKGWSWCSGSYNASHGYRNEAQIPRYFWDVIDDNNDSGLDDTNLSMQQFVGLLEAMPCAGNQAGVDGSCEEQGIPQTRSAAHPFGPCGFFPFPNCECFPVNDGTTWPDTGAGTTGTRDSYNVYDFAEMIAGLAPGQTNERTLNCVQGALD